LDVFSVSAWCDIFEKNMFNTYHAASATVKTAVINFVQPQNLQKPGLSAAPGLSGSNSNLGHGAIATAHKVTAKFCVPINPCKQGHNMLVSTSCIKSQVVTATCSKLLMCPQVYCQHKGNTCAPYTPGVTLTQ
jgi:hypothetical protein